MKRLSELFNVNHYIVSQGMLGGGREKKGEWGVKLLLGFAYEKIV